MSFCKENEIIGMRLRKVREDMGLSYLDMASVINVSESQYRKIERGHYCIDAKKLRMFYLKLNIDPLYLLVGRNEREEEICKNIIKEEKITKKQVLSQLLELCRKELEEDYKEEYAKY